MLSIKIRVGCTGWTIPKPHADKFSSDGSHLERYAQHFSVVEINSTFYCSHRQATYTRWASSVPEDFQFSVKMPKEITHVHCLKEVAALDAFLAEIRGLGAKLSPCLIQLLPSLAFDDAIVGKFFEALRQRFIGSLVCEPRHASWFTPEVDRLLTEFHVARAATDPALNQIAAEPGGWLNFVYYRLHGSPRKYYSEYTSEYLAALTRKLIDAATRSESVWCIFDNTASGAATVNALDVLQRI